LSLASSHPSPSWRIPRSVRRSRRSLAKPLSFSPSEQDTFSCSFLPSADILSGKGGASFPFVCSRLRYNELAPSRSYLVILRFFFSLSLTFGTSYDMKRAIRPPWRPLKNIALSPLSRKGTYHFYYLVFRILLFVSRPSVSPFLLLFLLTKRDFLHVCLQDNNRPNTRPFFSSRFSITHFRLIDYLSDFFAKVPESFLIAYTTHLFSVLVRKCFPIGLRARTASSLPPGTPFL